MIIRAIKSIKETFGQVFHSPEATATWTSKDDAETFTNDAKRHYEPYLGVPAPVVSPSDVWFSEPVVTEKGMDYMVQETKIKQQEEEHKKELIESGLIIEEENIHQKMYEMATRSGNTTLQLNPIGGSENFQGGSENFHER